MDQEPDTTRGEQARIWRVPGMDGVELMRARFVTQNFSRHVHDCYALGVIEQGGLAFRYLGRSHLAGAGSVNLVVPGEAHDGHAADQRGWSYRMCYIDPDWLERAGRELGWTGSRLPFFRSGVLEDRELARRVLALHRAMEDPGSGVLERQTRLYQALVLWVGRHAEDAPRNPAQGREPTAVRRARAFLHAHPEREVSLHGLAREAGLSPFHLARTFTRAVGVPPHAYLVQVRVGLARDLIRTGTPLAQAAAEAGFADQSHLTRRFKRQFGVTPGSYQDAYRKSVQDA